MDVRALHGWLMLNCPKTSKATPRQPHAQAAKGRKRSQDNCEGDAEAEQAAIEEDEQDEVDALELVLQASDVELDRIAAALEEGNPPERPYNYKCVAGCAGSDAFWHACENASMSQFNNFALLFLCLKLVCADSRLGRSHSSRAGS
jgi:hypothetical protein